MKEYFPSYMYNRSMILIALCAACFFIIIIKLFFVQVINVSAVSKEAPILYKNVEKSKLNNQRKFQPLRGEIYSRSGDLFATTLYRYRVAVDATAVSDLDRQALIDTLVNRFDIDKQKFIKNLQEKQRYIVIGRRVKADVVEDLINSERKLSGLICELDDPVRVYPQDSFAAHIVGYINYAGQAAGIEKEYFDVLEGISAKSIHDVAVDGANVYLTIDDNIQYFVEEAIAWGYQTYNPQSISAVVLDPKTGEILAMANYPTFNPNKFNEVANSEYLQNSAVSYSFEPGSSFKIVTMAAALEENKVKESDVFFCNNGEIMYKGLEIKDTTKNGDLTVTGILKRSSNIGMVKIADMLGKNTLYNYTKLFGFTEKKNLEMSGENIGELRPLDKWSPSDTGSFAIGYGFATNLLRLTAAYGVIANNGVLNQMHIVKKITYPGGREIEIMPLTIRRVISVETAKRLSAMLVHVVEDGTALKSKVNGLKIAAKTGTSIVYDKKSNYKDRNRVIGTFVGYFPADDPQFVVGIMMNQPEKGSYAGESISPIFKKIAESIKRYNGM